MEQDAEHVAVGYGSAPVALPELALVGVKLLGLYALVHAIPMALSLPLYVFYGERRNLYALLEMLPAASYFALGIALIWNADWVVGRMLRVRSGEAPPMTFNEHFQAIAFSVVGVMLAAWG
ncbi:MAG: hypothetical protein M3478_12235, partial [Planctomycetota bacterium]|nr:hypothetical protein [Planctomycetota bacterium]